LAIKIPPQALDLRKKVLSQRCRSVSGENSQNQNIAPPNARSKEIRKHLKPDKASDEKLALGITRAGRRGLSRYSLFEARQDKNRAGREVTPNDESNETSG
jgi:hypothetical protein